MLFTLATLLVLFVASHQQTSPPALDPRLAELRRDVAIHYLEPEPHMRLARYYYDAGNRLQAFYILEYARRGILEAEVFNRAFESIFLGHEAFDNSPEAEANVRKALAAKPDSPDLLFKLADIYISRSDWPKARPLLFRLTQIEPDQVKHVAALAEVLARQGFSEQSDKLLDTFVLKHPETRDAYGIQIDRQLMKEEGNRAEVKRLLEEALAKFPNDPEFLFDLGTVVQNENQLDKAEKLYVRAAGLAPDSAHIQGWTGRFFFRVKRDEAKSLEYYLKAYFLDPDFYDSEHAEERVQILSRKFAESDFQNLLRSGKSLEEIAHNSNPRIASQAIDAMGESWKASYIDALIEAMTHDDEAVRGTAMTVLQEHPSPAFDARLKLLLTDEDLRRRGLAAYIAAKHWGNAVELVKPWLKEKAQLLRYDAISVLLEFGGPQGRQVILEHSKVEPDPIVKHWIEAALKLHQ